MAAHANTLAARRASGRERPHERRTQDRGRRADGDPDIGRSRALPQGGPEPGAEKKADDEPGHDRQPVFPVSLVDGLSDGIDRLAGLPGDVAERFRSSLRKNALRRTRCLASSNRRCHARIGRFEQMEKLVAVQNETSLALLIGEVQRLVNDSARRLSGDRDAHQRASVGVRSTWSTARPDT
jgi:hypothetical protein